MSTASVDTVIIGGGQAGLAIGYYLARAGQDFTILDANARTGDAWRARWDSLTLFTPAKYDGLPGMRFPADPLAIPTKDEQADYLERYAERFGLPVSRSVRVARLSRPDGSFFVEAAEQSWAARQVVLATGSCGTPRVPAFAGELAVSVTQLHSSRYRNPGQLQPGSVLVVGGGNSGAEIALEVSRTHPVTLAAGPSAQIPFRHGRALARYGLPAIRFAGAHVLNERSPIGRQVLPKMREEATPLIRTKNADLAAAGVTRVGRVAGASEGRAISEDGDILDAANVIWCTGYRADYAWIDLPGLEGNGEPENRRGIVDSAPGLFLLGQEFLFSALSATLAGIGRDARYLAGHLLGRRRSADSA